ncbi:DsrE family protein [Glaciecola sp. MF2-115]|uniref:DsrE family protein n=1 Tax=Glaciecola sp. MF2-115 TaxID=3384827 RepID=UPI00399FB47C
MTQLLIISTRPPYYSSAAQDALEAALAASNVGLSVTFVFMGGGLYQLLNGQDSKQIGKKSISKQIKAMPLYDIEPIYFMDSDLSERQISSNSMLNVANAISDLEFTHLCSTASCILRF